MELTIDQALQKAIGAHKAGQIQEADRLYTAILKAQPKHPHANHNMGVLAVAVGKVETALPFFRIALEGNPSIAQFWLSYIDALIKLDKLVEAKAVLGQAKRKGAKGNGFDKLEQRLSQTGEEPIASGKLAAVAPPPQPNILDSLTMDQAISLAKKKSKDGSPEEAKRIFQDILTKFPKNKRASDGLKRLVGSSVRYDYKRQEPSQTQIQELLNLYSQGQLQQALHEAATLIQRFPKSATLFNLYGAILCGLGQLDASVEAYKKAIAIQPDYAEAYNNMGIVLKELNMLKESIESYKKALAIQPNFADASYNIGIVFEEQGKLEEAIEAYNKALAIKPDYAEAYNNMGIVFKEQGKLARALDAYKKALVIKPDFVEVFNNMGIVLHQQGKLDEAVAMYQKAVSLMPDHAKAHLNLSSLVKYKAEDTQVALVSELIQRSDLKDDDRCRLYYTLAKMKEDLGDFEAAYANYVAGGKLRQTLLFYDFKQDELIFEQIKNTAPKFKELSFNKPVKTAICTPIFILGMPRSGTTLVEQIISSHSTVYGAGELPFLARFGDPLILGDQIVNSDNILQMRNAYLCELENVSNGCQFVTDKMPQNFLQIGLLLKALPEAKVIHVQRDPAATCWSNFKHYFDANALGYSYSLSDTVKYHGLYKDLMHFWYQSYDDRIYNLDYEKLTEHQEPETRRLIEYLGLKWEDLCLAPHQNKKSVRTASSIQVRQRVYTGSSQAWRKYEPFLDGIFEQLED